MAHVAVTATEPVLDCLWLEKVTRTAEEDGTPLLPVMATLIERRSSLLSPSNYSHKNCGKLKEKDQSTQLRGTCHSLPSPSRLESEPAASPVDSMQFLAQHVQGYMAAQGYLCHLQSCKKRAIVSPDPCGTIRCFHPSC